MPHYHDIQLRFLRRNQPDITDDILRIMKLGENSVRAIYTEVSADGRVIDVQTIGYQQLMSYLYRIFWLLALDDDPFDSVQFFLPGYPTILVRVSAIKENITHLLELIAHMCHTWPSIGRTGSLPPVGNP